MEKFIPATCDMQQPQNKNDQWIQVIKGVEEEINAFQATSSQTQEAGYAAHYLAIAQFWLEKDKVKIAQTLGGVAHREAQPR